jgi:ATP-binding cassette subfamily F protein uup
MEQDPDLSGFPTLGDFAAAGLGEGQSYRAERAAEGLGFDPELPVATASGGERRRAALARLLAQEPALMLLDEPTNHLDIAAIEWLEAELSQTRAAFVLISHDRAFQRTLSRATLWLDRGELRRRENGFESFETWRDEVWAAEDLARHKLDRKIKAEGKWAVEGISARRKRNMGRVRALAELRRERAEQLRRPDTAALALEAGPVAGRRVIEAKGISKAFDGRTLFRPADIRVQRGDRVALVGPNGAGKTTLLRVLTGLLPPDTGTVTLGTGLEMVVLDQGRAVLDPAQSLWDTLTGDPELRGAGSDQVMVRGAPRHVVGYLKDFLFTEDQARAPVSSLSGGEKARLLLARIMARHSNLLVLDEPTNDLDVETLDLLQELVADFDGTVIVVSHDRDFLDRVATMTLAMEGDGRVTAYPGGWTDYRAQRPQARPAAAPSTARKPAVPTAKAAPPAAGLTFTEKHRLEALPGLMDRLTAEIGKLGELLSDADLFSREPVKFRKASEALAERQAALAAAEEEWLNLAEKAEG